MDNNQLVRTDKVDRLPSVKRQSFVSSEGKDRGDTITCFSSAAKIYGKDYEQHFTELFEQLDEI